jgi:heme exporter protein A
LLDVTNLACIRGDRPLFSHLSFALKPGELVHVTGANGSGKTTLLRTLCGLSRPAAGEIRWNGADIHDLGDDYRGALAYVGHLNGNQGELTLRENLRVAAGIAGHETAPDTALEQVGLLAYGDFPAKILSQGQKRRLALARLLVAHKKLWILDEPFSALDARSTEVMNALLSAHLAAGGMIVLTSHQDLAIELRTELSVALDS